MIAIASRDVRLEASYNLHTSVMHVPDANVHRERCACARRKIQPVTLASDAKLTCL